MTAAPLPFERYRGEMVWRDQWERQAYEHDAKLREWLGRTIVDVPTRGGRRRHICTVVAVHQHRYSIPRWPCGGFLWLSALTRARWERSPRGKDHGSGTVILRIERSTAPNMIGRYLRVGRFI